jgi:hypothetical protein
MNKILLISIIMASCLICLCKDPQEPQVVITGIGDLVSDNFTDLEMRASADPTETVYGFDADPNSREAYLSVKAGATNTFRLRSKYIMVVLPGDGGLISTVTKGSNLVADYTYQYTVTAGMLNGSQKLSICMDNGDAGKHVYYDIEDLSWDPSDGEPLKLYTKVYNQTTFPDINVYYMYNTTTDLSNLKDNVNRIAAQAVCKTDNVLYLKVTDLDKSWDLDGNGLLDIYPNDPSNTKDEFLSIKAWAKTKNYWSDEVNGILALDKPFSIHGSTDLIYGATLENFIVMPSGPLYDDVCHEFLHSTNAGHLMDITDEYNIMYYAQRDMTNEVLRYRPEARVSGGTEQQWQILTGTTY